jgi:hypothetical protein
VSLDISVVVVGGIARTMLRDALGDATIQCQFLHLRRAYAHLRHNQRDLSQNSLLDALRRKRRTVFPSDQAPHIHQYAGHSYGTKMADAVAPVSFIASSTVAKTGLPRCSVPAFLGFVPPTTFVPILRCQFVSSVLSKRVVERAHTIFDGLLGVEPVNLSATAPLPIRSQYCTHVPCFPVKPWNSTLVSPLMRRFLIVWAYGDELVAYPCRAAAVRRAELRGRRRACIVTMELPRKQIWERMGV